MGKNKYKKNNQNTETKNSTISNKVTIETEEIKTASSDNWLQKLTTKFVPYIIISVLGILIYSNTFNAKFALDDDIVICKNEYVLQGLQGLPDIFSKDLFDSFYKQMNTTAQLAGGRYRPLSVATFAIEQEFIGTRDNAIFEKNCWDANKNGIEDANEDINKDGLFNDKDCRAKGFGMRHVNNVLLYAGSVCLLFFFLSTVIFKENKLLALIISLLFLAHPIHTEVVANVKSRDEIMSLLFMILSLIMAHKYALHRSMKWLFLTCISFMCALLSKEYGATLLILIPLSIYLFEEKKINAKKYFPLILGLMFTFAIYYVIRSGIVIGKSNLQDNELMNNPYLLADDAQKLATKFFIFLKYLLLMIYPNPLSSDYGYNSIPYKDFSNIEVWLSIFVLLGIIVAGFISLNKKSWLAFAIAFYMLTILLVTNLIFNVGATMGERLAFHASLGFCMVLGYGLTWVAKKMNNNAIAVYLCIPILILYSIKTFARNKAWDSDITLALTDVNIMPNSVSLNGNAASRYIDLSELPKNKSTEMDLVRKSVQYGTKAVKLHPGFVNGYLNLGLAYAKLEKFDSAKIVWDKAFLMYPSHPSKKLYFDLLADSYYRKGYNMGASQNWIEGENLLLKAVEINPSNARYWYDLGGFAYNAKDFAKAKEAWSKAYQLDPNDTTIQKVQGLLK